MGYYIELDSVGAVTWVRCAHCRRPLSDPESRARGIGPDCLELLDADECARVREVALVNDRECFRFDRDVADYRAAVLEQRYRQVPVFADWARGRRPGRYLTRRGEWVAPWARRRA